MFALLFGWVVSPCITGFSTPPSLGIRQKSQNLGKERNRRNWCKLYVMGWPAPILRHLRKTTAPDYPNLGSSWINCKQLNTHRVILVNTGYDPENPKQWKKMNVWSVRILINFILTFILIEEERFEEKEIIAVTNREWKNQAVKLAFRTSIVKVVGSNFIQPLFVNTPVA